MKNSSANEVIFQFELPQLVLLSHAATVLDLKYQIDHDRYNVRQQS